MKQASFLIVAVLLLASCTKQAGYTISGTISNKQQTTIYLQQRIDKTYKNIDSTQLIDGKFEFKGKVEVPDIYYLSKDGNDRLMFFLENGATTITADSVLLSDANIAGGEVQQLFGTYQTAYNQMDEALMKVYEQWKQEQNLEVKKQLELQVDSLDAAVSEYQKKFMLDHPTSPVAAYLLTQIQYGKDGEELGQLLSKLDKSLSTTVSYQSIAKRVEKLQSIATGIKAPDFTQNDANGNPISFSSVYAKNSYTLVDFWASWCGPCRAENPNVVAAFQQFSRKGFGVFGVSLDTNKERWMKAIADDQLTWPHVSDLKGWDNEAADKYAVNSIPASFLVDKNGTIVGTNLRGNDLLKKLEELLK
jgi:peroxiredoxin